jgi:hypothetical protein
MSPGPTTGTPLPLRVLSAPVVVVVLIAGGWAAGALISNDFKVSMLLTAVWVGLVGLACVRLVHRRRELWPALAAFVVTAAVAGLYLGSQTLLDDRVDEDVVTATSRSGANTLLGRGPFESLAHDTTGVAQAIELRGRRRVLTLTDFETDNGPDLRVYLSSAEANQDSAGDFVDLGALKGNIGDQQYEIPPSADLGRLTKVVVWCRAFSVGFGAAALREA